MPYDQPNAKTMDEKLPYLVLSILKGCSPRVGKRTVKLSTVRC